MSSNLVGCTIFKLKMRSWGKIHDLFFCVEKAGFPPQICENFAKAIWGRDKYGFEEELTRKLLVSFQKSSEMEIASPPSDFQGDNLLFVKQNMTFLNIMLYYLVCHI